MLKLLRTASLIILSGCVSTESHLIAPEKYYFDCDVPPGNSSEWNRTITGSEVRVSGNLQLVEPRRDPTWAPVANVSISGVDHSPRVGLGAGIDWHIPDVVTVAPVTLSGPEMSQVLLSKAWDGLSIPFAVSVKRSGEFSVSAAAQSRALHIQGFDMRKVRLSCSTGHFRFTDVVVEIVK